MGAIKSLVFFFMSIAMMSFCSCTNNRLPNEVSLQRAFSIAEDASDTVNLLICDYRQYYQLGKNPGPRFVRKYMRNAGLLYTDISLPRNRPAQYIFEFESLPSIIKIAPGGRIALIEYVSGNDTISPNVSDTMKLLIDGISELSKEVPCSEIFEEIDHNASLNDNIFANYLLSQYFSQISDEVNSNKYRNRLVSSYERNPEIFTEPLYIEALKELNDSLTHITLYPTSFSFTDFPTRSDTTVYVLATNYGTKPFVMTDVRTSCSCVKVKYPRVIEINKTDTLSITFSSGDNEKEFNQKIVIGQTMYNNQYVVSLKGNTI